MKKAPSTLAAAIMLAVFLFLGNGNVLAQCSLCVSAVDYDCSGTFEECGTSTAGCSQSTIFQVACSGNYTLIAKIEGCTNACNCNSCVLIEKVDSGTILRWLDSGCSGQHCSASVQVELAAGYDYRLYVCKRPCDEGLDCDDCDQQCKARGLIKYGVVSCP